MPRITVKPKRGQRVEFAKSRNGWRWKAYAKNGECLAVSSEAYTTKEKALLGADRTRDALTFGTWDEG